MNVETVSRVLRAEYELGEYSPVCALLGVGDTYWEHALVRIALSSVRCEAAMRRRTESAPPVEIKDSGVMVHGPRILPSVGRCTLTPGSWPCSASASVKVEGGTAYISVMGLTLAAGCRAEGDVVTVEWPDGLGLEGALQLPEGGEAVLPILPAYPVESVISLAKADSNVYNLLRETEYSSAFFTETDPNEQLAILVLALYIHYITNNGHSS